MTVDTFDDARLFRVCGGPAVGTRPRRTIAAGPVTDRQTTRVWRARKRHDQIDAVLVREGARCELRFLLNRRLLLSLPCMSDAEARAAADARLRELQRAGWNPHW